MQRLEPNIPKSQPFDWGKVLSVEMLRQRSVTILVGVRGQLALLCPKSAILVLPLSHKHPILCVIDPRISHAEVLQEGNVSEFSAAICGEFNQLYGVDLCRYATVLSRRSPQDDTCILSTTAKTTCRAICEI